MITSSILTFDSLKVTYMVSKLLFLEMNLEEISNIFTMSLKSRLIFVIYNYITFFILFCHS